MLYNFSEASEKIFLEKILKFHNVETLGRGTQSHVWKGQGSDGTNVAVKLHFGNESDLKAEKILNGLKPEELQKSSISELFGKDTKLQGTSKRYYKYSIIFQNHEQQDENLEIILDYDLADHNTDLTVKNIFNCAEGIKGEKIKTFDELNTFFQKTKATGLFKRKILEQFHKVEESYLTDLITLFKSYDPSNRFYVSKALLADKNLNSYIKSLEEKQSVECSVKEIRKIAKHILKALSALYNDGIIHRDLHGGNITRTIVNPKGRPQKIKYQLIDFGASLQTDKETDIQDDLRSLGYGVLIPVFYQLQYPQETPLEPSKASNYKKVDEMAHIQGIDKLFIDFLYKLDTTYKTADEALKHPFINKKD